MVILIAGAGCTGKTFLAQNLLEKYKMPYLSIDHLKMGIYRNDNNCGFSPESKDEIITKKLWGIVKGIIMTNIENDQNIIIEGCYFPESIGDLGQEYLSKITFFYLIFSEEYIRNYFLEKIIEKRNIIENRGGDYEESKEFVEQYILQNRLNKDICIKNGIKYFEFYGDYDMEIENICAWIDEEKKRIYYNY